MIDLRLGDCLDILPTLEPDTFDGCLCDPPYELGFMGKHWDASGITYNVDLWRQVYRVLKPGAYLLAFGGTRTSHRLACAIEDAGFEIRDTIDWVYGSGFPKSSRVNRDPRFCQCASSGRNELNKDLSQRQLSRICNLADAGGDVLQQKDAHHLTHREQDCRGDYLMDCDSCDEPAHSLKEDGQESSPLQGCAQGHSHSCEREDGQAVESCDSPSLVQCKTRPSSRDYSRRARSGSAKQGNTQESTSCAGISQSDSRILGNDLNLSSCTSDTDYATGFPLCQVCGKPIVDGYGTALKPAHEPVVVARKPLSEATVAANCQKWGTGALNIDASRIPTNWATDPTRRGWQGGNATNSNSIFGNGGEERVSHPSQMGRFPTNLITDGSVEVVAMFPVTGISRGGNSTNIGGFVTAYADEDKRGKPCGFGDSGSAARFFKSCPIDDDDYPPLYYCAKASKAERDAGCEGIEKKFAPKGNYEGRDMDNPKNHLGGLQGSKQHNHHPTVKPISLTRYLATLILPPAEYAPRRMLVPFAGVASEMIGAMLAGWDEVIGIEREAEYCEIGRARIEYWSTQMPIAIQLPMKVTQ